MEADHIRELKQRIIILETLINSIALETNWSFTRDEDGNREFLQWSGSFDCIDAAQYLLGVGDYAEMPADTAPSLDKHKLKEADATIRELDINLQGAYKTIRQLRSTILNVRKALEEPIVDARETPIQRIRGRNDSNQKTSKRHHASQC